MNNPNNNSLLQLTQCNSNTLSNIKDKLIANTCNWLNKSSIIAYGNEADIYSVCCNNNKDCNYIIKHILPPKQTSDEDLWKAKIENEIDINVRYPSSLKPIDICGCFNHGIFIVYEKRQYNIIDYILFLKQSNTSTKFIIEQLFGILYKLIDPTELLKEYINNKNKIDIDDKIRDDIYLKLDKNSIIKKALANKLIHNDIQKQNIMFNINADNSINLNSLSIIDFGKSYIFEGKIADKFIISNIHEIVLSFNKYIDYANMDYNLLKKEYDDEKRKEKEDRERKIKKMNKTRDFSFSFNSSNNLSSYTPKKNNLLSPSFNNISSINNNSFSNDIYTDSENDISFLKNTTYNRSRLPPSSIKNTLTQTPTSNIRPSNFNINTPLSDINQPNFNSMTPLSGLIQPNFNNTFSPVLNQPDFGTPKSNIRTSSFLPIQPSSDLKQPDFGTPKSNIRTSSFLPIQPSSDLKQPDFGTPKSNIRTSSFEPISSSPVLMQPDFRNSISTSDMQSNSNTKSLNNDESFLSSSFTKINIGNNKKN
jgi:hypothetical protein